MTSYAGRTACSAVSSSGSSTGPTPATRAASPRSTCWPGRRTPSRFAVAFARGGVLVGAVAVNSPKDLIRIRRAIGAGDRLDAVS
ncbi:oxidoreductase C-terminal domain-containing protein [Nonomuraea rubra]|uniref:oxidoreductase C-terminal domain-containing protein n=1 Tax=Nonomuraea rubra TaxID=46180 RepID=UPI0033C0ABAC